MRGGADFAAAADARDSVGADAGSRVKACWMDAARQLPGIEWISRARVGLGKRVRVRCVVGGRSDVLDNLRVGRASASRLEREHKRQGRHKKAESGSDRRDCVIHYPPEPIWTSFDTLKRLLLAAAAL
jgi:hypothetical protein